jgi:hypothetical protein
MNMAIDTTYHSFQGIVSLATAGSNGLEEYEVGNCPQLSIELSTETIEHNESWSGQRLTDLRLIKAKKANVKMVLESFSLDNLALGLYGQATSRAAGTVTAESLGAVQAGKVYPLANPLGVSSVAVKDGGGTAVPAAKYELDATFGAIKVLDTTGTTMPWKVDYAYGAAKNLAMFMAAPQPRRLRLRAVNTAAGNAPVLIELWRVQFDPIKSLAMIQDDLGKLELDGSVLADPTKAADAMLGMFGRVITA